MLGWACLKLTTSPRATISFLKKKIILFEIMATFFIIQNPPPPLLKWHRLWTSPKLHTTLACRHTGFTIFSPLNCIAKHFFVMFIFLLAALRHSVFQLQTRNGKQEIVISLYSLLAFQYNEIHNEKEFPRYFHLSFHHDREILKRRKQVFVGSQLTLVDLRLVSKSIQLLGSFEKKKIACLKFD